MIFIYIYINIDVYLDACVTVPDIAANTAAGQIYMGHQAHSHNLGRLVSAFSESSDKTRSVGRLFDSYHSVCFSFHSLPFLSFKIHNHSLTTWLISGNKLLFRICCISIHLKSYSLLHK